MVHAVKIVFQYMCSESIISENVSGTQGRKRRKEEEQESQVNHCVLVHDV